MNRRNFILGVGGATAWPLAGHAQQPAIPMIGLLGSATADAWKIYVSAFRDGLREVGYVEGRNVEIEARWANGQYDRLPAMASELVQRKVTVIAAFSTPAARAAKAATTAIPIVFTTNRDPVQIGFVASLGRPGGNMTGATSLAIEVESKLLELLHDAVPGAKAVAVLVNPANFNAEAVLRLLQPDASKLGLQLHGLNASTELDLHAVSEDLRRLKADGIVVISDVFFSSQSKKLAKLALDHGLPMISQDMHLTAAGGMISYAGSIREEYHQAGVYTGRILKGERPADLPVVEATQLELVINLKTAKALGLTIPPSLLARADEVIE